MNDLAIRVENLGKCFRVGRQDRYLRLSESLQTSVSRLFRAPRNRSPAKERSEFWAIRDLSFDVKRGEVVGIIGRNGAGKSTLLKILSRITEPTCGRYGMRGRVGSLLEVGTGFHPELTGRENVYLSGTILGMTSAEIRRRFDEIVDFAGVGKFIDTPVKRYSSGMYVRLGFAIAAHLELEILIVDEVLAVGDIAFQRNCMDRMDELSRSGKTVLFVSHNLAAIQRLCGRTMVLRDGRIDCFSETDFAVEQYLTIADDVSNPGVADVSQAERRGGTERAIRRISLHDNDGRPTGLFRTGDSIIVRTDYELREPIEDGFCQLIFYRNGTRVMSIATEHTGDSIRFDKTGTLECRLNDTPLAGGSYSLDVTIGRGGISRDVVDRACSAVQFRIDLGNYLNGIQLGPNQAIIAQRGKWSHHDDGRADEHRLVAGS